jgi:Helicase conserved C-terminal domain
MPDLKQSLQGRDIGHLRIVAGLCGLELTAAEREAALEQLSAALLDPELVAEIQASLPAGAREALAALTAEGGRLPWAAFARRFGEIREVGPGRRDSEQVYLHPVSAAEMLFYRALLARAFFDAPSGPQEFAYVPEDLLKLIHHEGHKGREEEKKESVASVVVKPVGEPLGRPATPIERALPLPADDRMLDDACTLLAALRLGWSGVPQPEGLGVPENVLKDFLLAARLILPASEEGGEKGHLPQLEPVRSFLAASRGEAQAQLAKAWLTSETFDELRQLPGLACEGEWTDQPLVTREFLLNLLAAVPAGQWWSLNAFVRLVKEKYADFQRPAGDYDSWFIKRLSDGAYLRGFASWDEVDGALVRYLITGPLHWLGILDLAVPDAEKAPSAFRFTAAAGRLLEGLAPQKAAEETGRLTVSSQGRITVPRLVPRAARYQVARFCDWEEGRADEYRYRVAPSSLQRAREQGLKIEQLLGLLQKHAAAPIPPAFVRAVQRWEKQGTEARLERRLILRLGSPAVLEELRKSKVARFLGEPLGPTTVVVTPGAQAKVLAALAEMGLLAEDQTKADIIDGESG